MTPAPSEDGFTLVELLVALVLMGMIFGVITQVIIVGLRTTDETNTRLAASHDAQLLSAYFVTDAQSASTVTTTATPCPDLFGDQLVVGFSWTDATSTRAVSYLVRAASGERQLVRRVCVDGTVQADHPVAHTLPAAAVPVVACDAGPCRGTQPTTVSLTVTVGDGYTFTLTGRRRTS